MRLKSSPASPMPPAHAPLPAPAAPPAASPAQLLRPPRVAACVCRAALPASPLAASPQCLPPPLLLPVGHQLSRCRTRTGRQSRPPAAGGGWGASSVGCAQAAGQSGSLCARSSGGYLTHCTTASRPKPAASSLPYKEALQAPTPTHPPTATMLLNRMRYSLGTSLKLTKWASGQMR